MKKFTFFAYGSQIVGEKPAGKQRAYQAHQSISYTSYSNISRENHSQVPRLPTERIAPVPRHLAIEPNRFYLWHQGDFERWAIAIELTEREARSLLPLVEGERDRAVILKIVESAIAVGGAV